MSKFKSTIGRLSVFLLTSSVFWAAGGVLPANAQDGPIQDNSFLIEEAYNQGARVVQHITTFSRTRGNGDQVYTFTQEWPAPGLRHQLSFAVPWQRFGEQEGIGDLALNYRYQLLGSGDDPVAFAPRTSLLLPTGDEEKGLGAGAAGLQINLPLSVALGERFVTHVNLGATHTPKARNERGAEADLTAYHFGQSFVWLAAPRFNALVELLYTAGEEVAGPGRTEESDSFLISPGVRWAWNLPSGLQIVPGAAFTFGAGPSSGEKSVFFYLSFEHPF